MNGVESSGAVLVLTSSNSYSRVMGAVLVILSALGFSTLGVFGKIAVETGFSRNQALAWRFGLAIPFLYFVLRALKVTALFREPAVRAKFFQSIAIGAVGIGLEASLYFLTLE